MTDSKKLQAQSEPVAYTDPDCLKRQDEIIRKLAKENEELDNQLTQALQERDRYHDVADALAAGVALHFDADIGEHSNMNNPWQNALDFLEGGECAEVAKPAPVQAQSEPQDAFMAMHSFLLWNRRLDEPLVKLASEYHVFETAVELYLASQKQIHDPQLTDAEKERAALFTEIIERGESGFAAAMASRKAAPVQAQSEPVAYRKDGKLFHQNTGWKDNTGFEPLYTASQVAAAVAKAKSVPMKYKRMAFNAELQERIATIESVLRVALEALEEATTYTSSPSWSPSMTEECNKAIAQIMEVLHAD